MIVDPPREFSRDDLGDPTITFLEETDVAVSLLCKVNILNGVEKWKNVSYRIEWFAEGKSLKSEDICGGLLPGEVNDKSCPDGELHSTLEPTLYKIGQWVRSTENIIFIRDVVSFVLFMIRHLLCHYLITKFNWGSRVDAVVRALALHL